MDSQWMHWNGRGEVLWHHTPTNTWRIRPPNPGYQTPFNPSPPRVPVRGPLPMNPPQMAKFLVSQGGSPKSLRSAIGSRAGQPYMGLNPDQLRAELSKHVWAQRKANVYNGLKTGVQNIANFGKNLIPRLGRAAKSPIVWGVIAAVAAIAGIAYLIYRGVKAATEKLPAGPAETEQVELGPPRSIAEMWQYGRSRVHHGFHYVHPRLLGVYNSR